MNWGCKLYVRHRFKPPRLLQKAPLLFCLSHTRQLSVDVPFAWCISGDLPGWRRKTQLQSGCGNLMKFGRGYYQISLPRKDQFTKDTSRINTSYDGLLPTMLIPRNNEYKAYLKGEYMKWYELYNDMLSVAHSMLPSRLVASLAAGIIFDKCLVKWSR